MSFVPYKIPKRVPYRVQYDEPAQNTIGGKLDYGEKSLYYGKEKEFDTPSMEYSGVAERYKKMIFPKPNPYRVIPYVDYDEETHQERLEREEAEAVLRREESVVILKDGDGDEAST